MTMETFVVDQENGSTILFNEYVSDTEFVKKCLWRRSYRRMANRS